MTESQLKQVIEFAHQAGQRNAGIDASPQAARDYYQSLVQDGGLSFVIFQSSPKSRCCGRCDGVRDECVADMICDAHNEQGCEICYGARDGS